MTIMPKDPMPTERLDDAVDAPEPDVASLDEYTGYEDGDWYVVCERSNPNAWIRMRDTTTLDP